MVCVHNTNSKFRLLTWLSSGDPAYEMHRQATLGDVDFITGDYLAGEYVPCSMPLFDTNTNAEVNLANNAQAWRAGKHPRYEETAWEGLQQTIDVIAQKGIRVAINGGALDPKALAQKVATLVSKNPYPLPVPRDDSAHSVPDIREKPQPPRCLSLWR